MKKHILVAVIAMIAVSASARVAVPRGADHRPLDALLTKYVNERGLVDYKSWKNSAEDVKTLEDYLSQYITKPKNPASGNEAAAALINLYNATVIHFILQNYPTESIMSLPDAFGTARHRVNGGTVSLNDIEHGTLRPLIGYRAHAVLVCAARSCPPLQRHAFTVSMLDGQIDDAYRIWLARQDMNRYLPEKKTVEISSIFNWFKDDFTKAGGVPKILAHYAPANYRNFLAGGGYEIQYQPYNWGLNDQGGRGKGYSRSRLYLDRLLDFLTFWN